MTGVGFFFCPKHTVCVVSSCALSCVPFITEMQTPSGEAKRDSVSVQAAQTQYRFPIMYTIPWKQAVTWLLQPGFLLTVHSHCCPNDGVKHVF